MSNPNVAQSNNEHASRRTARVARLTRLFRADGSNARAITRLTLFALSLLVVSVGSVMLNFQTGDVAVQAGDAASRTIKSPVTLTFESELKTEEKRREAYEDERNIARIHDESVRSNQLSELEAFLQAVDVHRADSSQPLNARVNDLRAKLEELSEAEATALLRIDPASWERVRAESLRLVDTTLSNRIQIDEIARIKEDVEQRVSALLASDEQRLAVAVGRPFLRPNVFVDEERTLTNRQHASAAVEPVTVTVLEGQAVVRDGDIVTPYDIEKLERLGLLAPAPDLSSRLGKAGIMGLLSLCLVAYLYRFYAPVWRGRQLLLIWLVVLGPIVLGRLVLPHDEIQYMFPIAAAAMLLAVLLDFQIAAIVAAVLSLYLGVIAGLSFELVVFYFLGAVAGAFAIWRADRTVTFVWSGMVVAAVSFAVAACFTALESDVESGQTAELLIESVVNGALSASLTFLSFSLLGSLFGITTHLQLMELAHPNQPLLYRLAREAPGTYHHSIVVSNLAESGVEIVGGDPLFARVAVLYHDIGKIVRPTFFIENQANLENPHDLLDPVVSARVIIDHVTDGVRLAKKARLPQPILDVIQQHHGTTLIRYFYCKAADADAQVSEDEFRYPGPKPQTKESGVIMLADSVEAAVRAAASAGRLASAKEPNREGAQQLEAIVSKVIQERLDDGQLGDCDLTLREIEQIRRTFVQILEGIYHPRVEYPSLRVPATEQPSPAASPAG